MYEAAFDVDMKRKECTESCSKAIGPEDRGVGGCCLVGFVLFFLFYCRRLQELICVLER